MRYTVFIAIDINANNPLQARDKIQKLADVLNKKDPNNKAWIPKVKENHTKK